MGAPEVLEMDLDPAHAERVLTIVSERRRGRRGPGGLVGGEIPLGILLRDDRDTGGQELRIAAGVVLVMISDDEDAHGQIGDLRDPSHLRHQRSMMTGKLPVDEDQPVRAEPEQRIGAAPRDQVEPGPDEVRRQLLTAWAHRRRFSEILRGSSQGHGGQPGDGQEPVEAARSP